LNEYDSSPSTQAVQLKEQLGGAPELVVLSIGPGAGQGGDEEGPAIG
jgi:electron transfer flavoprotein alpha/beta subunit